MAAPFAPPARPVRPKGTPAEPRLFGMPVARFKILLFIVGLLPLARWIWLAANDGLTANPVEFLTRSSGTWTLVALLATLSVSPLRVWLAQPALLRVRRMCGLFAFFYACLHFTTYVWWDQWFDLTAMLRDVARRPFITAGFAALLGLLVLAATSTRGWMRRLGPRWQALHRLVYAVGMLALLHYWWQKAGKHDFFEVFIYTVVFAGLMGWRLVRWRRRRN
ncbi:Sulfoxide reductase heme-binding subunit YedZ [Pigmentiphaga humi]|uniref:Protein-methionine-sulfoxide reductase heme-binding subunit MsrQ n=1 Tax=Pigmentiphaga humi TaxID=2478468 RepID=A0A3P4AYU3_9BURK|nr:Sulfoxide reductase heme-binding subunit YedZ [Pigmentiphaga humi]